MSKYRSKTNFTPKLGLKSRNCGPKLLGHSLLPSIVIKHRWKQSEYATSDESYEYVGILIKKRDISQKPNFGSKLGLNDPNLGHKNFFNHFHHFHQLDTMPAYHNMQNQEMIQTQENDDQKPQIWANLGLICPNLGQKFFFRKSGFVTFLTY